MKRRTVTKPPPQVESTLASINSIIDGTCLRCSKPIPADSMSDIYCSRVEHAMACCSQRDGCGHTWAPHLPGECDCGGGIVTTCQDAAPAAREPVPAPRRPEGRSPSFARGGYVHPPRLEHYLESVGARVSTPLALGIDPVNILTCYHCACGQDVCRTTRRTPGLGHVSSGDEQRFLCGQDFARHALPELLRGAHGIKSVAITRLNNPPITSWARAYVFTCMCSHAVHGEGDNPEEAWREAISEFKRHQAVGEACDLEIARHFFEHRRGPSMWQFMTAHFEAASARRRAAEASAGGDVTYVVDSDSNEQEGD